MTDHLYFREDPFRETRWKVRAANGEPTLASTEGYVHPEDAFTNAARYLLLEPTDDPDCYIVHTTEEVLTLVQDLEQAAGTHDTYVAHRVREVASQLRRLLQIPGGAR